MSAPFLELRHISKTFGGVKALQDVSFTIDRGEAYCLMGENGSGKSTLIKVMSGVYTPDEGEILLDGKSYSKLTPTESIKAGIQIIYQDFSVFPNLSVAENIALSNIVVDRKKFVNRKEMERVAAEALERIGVSLPLDANVEDLPVAGKQLVAIARGIAQDAKLLVMDEPTTALTHKEILALYEIVESLKKKGISVIFVSHKLEEVMAVSEKIAILRSGKKVLDSTLGEFDRNSLVYHMTGREIPDEPYEYVKDEEHTAPLLRLEKLSMKDAFKDVSFSLYSHEILGITGQLGCGRTELAKALFGIGTKTGRIFLDEKEVKINSVLDAHKLGIGYVPEDRLSEGLFLTRSLSDNVTVAAVDELADGIRLDHKKLVKVTEDWLKELDIAAENAVIPASNLSGGNQQRIVLAKWLATHPKILILNCPTVGVDVGSKHQIHQVVKGLARKGIGIIVISDDIGEIVTLCNRILVMKNGEVRREVQSKEVTVSELEQYLITAE